MVQQWLNGKRPISIEKALDIEEAFAIDAALLNSDVPLLEKRLIIRRLAKTL
jgi:DNA-binding transcriptional regulator YdaS (Cro superfamily)